MNRYELASLLFWTLIGLIVTMVINTAAVVIAGYTIPFFVLIALQAISFFEAGALLIIGGCVLMIGGFPTLSMATRKRWNHELERETRHTSYYPLLLGAFLLITSVLISLLIY